MPLDPNHELSSSSIALLQEAFAISSGATEIEEDLLVRFACGGLDGPSERNLISVIVQEPFARRQLGEILSELNVLRHLPASEAAASPLWTSIAKLVCERLNSLAAGVAGATRALAHVHQTSAFASVRGGEFEAEIDREGTLKVHTLVDRELYLADPAGEGIALGIPENGVLKVEGFTAMSGLRTGLLPADYFHSAPVDSPSHVFLEEKDQTAVAVELRGRPTVRDETLSISLGALPALAAPEGTLTITVPVGNTEVVLAHVPMSPWPPEGRRFDIPLPGVAFAAILTASILQFRVHR